MKTWHVHIEGRVQGVGFRPFIYRLAKELSLFGTVANTANGVHIYINAEFSVLQFFIEKIQQEQPPSSFISHVKHEEVSLKDFTSFNIIESNTKAQPKLLVTPDIALCEDCREDLKNVDDRRHNYAFTTCTQCGPRYSVMHALPYDRETTSMKEFTMCPDCKTEYDTVTDRRFYSQTNSCHTCGVDLFWLKGEGENYIEKTAQLLQAGKIVAVKGIGGFLLLLDATNQEAVQLLRSRKNRPFKPFACLFKGINQVREYAIVQGDEQKALLSPEAPIVLLNKKTDTALAEEVAPGLNKLGVMLPYAPILQLIADKVNHPLVATSANVSGSPIVFKDEEAVRLLDHLADAILSNNREIVSPQDDSVLTFSEKHRQKIWMRRSRGLAPSLNIDAENVAENTLALGAEMKSGFAFQSLGNSYASQYLGDTSSYESQMSYDLVLKNLQGLLKPEIKHVLVDKHPNYHNSAKGVQLAKEEGVALSKVQHHKAHFTAVLAENNLLGSENVLGVIWDGTGYGDDKQIWGGEFFKNDHELTRIAHLEYFPVVGGNRMAKEPAVACMALASPNYPHANWQEKNLSENDRNILPLLAEKSAQKCSSIGRLFDAVAGLLEVKSANSFEGEAATYLQVLAEKSINKTWNPLDVFTSDNLSGSEVLSTLMNLVEQGENIEELALRFHQTLVEWIVFIVEKEKVTQLAFSGGVFQNTLLVDLIYDRLNKYELYFHKNLSPNDENIAVGQLAYQRKLELREVDIKRRELCV